MTTIGQILRDARHAAGITQSELSKRAGISQGKVSEYEADQKCPSIMRVKQIADALGVKLSRLVKPLDEE